MLRQAIPKGQKKGTAYFGREKDLNKSDVVKLDLEATVFAELDNKHGGSTDAMLLYNRSTLEWVIDQYQVSTDKRSGIKSDPNRPNDPDYIVRLVGQVVRVSVETVKVVSGLPADFEPAAK